MTQQSNPSPVTYNNAQAIGPPRGSFAVTPSDTVDVVDTNGVTTLLRGFWVEVIGNVAVVYDDGSTDTLLVNVVGLPAGLVGGLIRRILATGTTATGIHGVV